MLPFFYRAKALAFLSFVLAGFFFLGQRGDMNNTDFFMKQAHRAAEIQMDTFIAAGLETYLNHLSSHLESFAVDADLLPFFRGNTAHEPQVRERWKQFLRLHAHVPYVYFANYEGKLFFEPNGKLPEGYDARRRPWFRHALLNPGRVTWTPPYTEIPTGKKVLSAVMALQDPDSGQNLGVLSMDLGIEELESLLGRIPLPENSFLGILASDGQLVASSHPEKMKTLLAHPSSLLAIMSGETNVFHENPETQLLITTRLLPQPHWRIIQGLPQSAWQLPHAPNRKIAFFLMVTTLGLYLFLRFLELRSTHKQVLDFENHINVLRTEAPPLPSPSPALLFPLADLCTRMAEDCRKGDEKIRILQSRLDTLIQKAPMGIFRSSPQGRFSEVNPAMAQILEYDSPEDLIHNMHDIERELYLDQQDRKVLQNRLLQGHILDFPTRFRKKNGTIGHACITAYPEYGPGGRIFSIWGFFTDISRQYQLEGQLRRMALTDRLTELPNRRSFMDLLVREAGRFCRYGASFTLLVLNVDQFRDINADYGHITGDKILCALAEAFTSVLRSCDTLARIDGDTFAIHLAETPLDEGLSVALRIQEHIHGLHWTEPPDLKITLSIGATAPHETLRCPDLLLQEAEGLMYAVKKKGGKGMLPLPAKSRTFYS
jgi:diguanylate cyclase (GGDEF)-like protein/PAS domain S-box-containing protein